MTPWLWYGRGHVERILSFRIWSRESETRQKTEQRWKKYTLGSSRSRCCRSSGRQWGSSRGLHPEVVTGLGHLGGRQPMCSLFLDAGKGTTRNATGTYFHTSSEETGVWSADQPEREPHLLPKLHPGPSSMIRLVCQGLKLILELAEQLRDYSLTAAVWRSCGR